MRPHPFIIAVLSGMLLGCLIALPLSAQTRTHTVQQILVDGRPVGSATGVTVAQGATVEHTLQRNEPIPDGTTIDVPEHVTVIVTSTGGKSTVTLEPGASVTFVSTGAGELLSRNAGTILFNVVHGALDFFRVQSGEALTASVPGTAFSISGSGGSVTFTVTRDEVNITKTGYLLIGAKRLKASLTDVISASRSPSVTYHPSAIWYLASFVNFAQAEAFYEQQLTAARRSGDGNTIAAALRNVGITQLFQGRYADALQSDQQALALFQQLGDRDGEASAITIIGNVQMGQGQYADALQSYRQALALFQQLADRDGEASAVDNIGIVQRDQEQYADALQSYRQALALHQQLGDRDGEAHALGNIGVVQEEQGQYADALQSHRQALALFQQLGDRDLEAYALDNIGNVQTDQGQYADALQSHRQALALFQQLGDRDGEARTLNNIGVVQEDQRNYGDALQSYEQSLTIAQQIGDQSLAATAAANIQRVQSRLQQPPNPPQPLQREDRI